MKPTPAQRELQTALEAWPAPAPDPGQMARVAQRMHAAMVAANAPEPGEALFRLLTVLWGAVALTVYLAWSLLANWFSLHPGLTAVLTVAGGLCLLAPLALLPVLYARRPGPAPAARGGA